MSSRIEDLEPQTQALCLAFLQDCEAAGLSVRVTHTLRTMDEQAHLYAKGRSIPGSIVTNAKPGQSAHNYGMAFDICFNGKSPWVGPWDMVGTIGERIGLAWGGRWKKIVDRPHFERPDWKIASGQRKA